MCTQETPLPITFITKEESKKRQQWFNDHKLPVLNALTLAQERKQEKIKHDFKDIDNAIYFFKMLIEERENANGVRVYISSPSGDGSVGQNSCGIFSLIFVATIEDDKKDMGPYFSFDENGFFTIETDEAKKGIHNYQLIKRKHLFKTLSDLDISYNSGETKHIWFSLKQMQQTIKEMVCQKERHGDLIKGFGIRFTSYTNDDYVFFKSPIPEYKRRRRLTICFTFISVDGRDIGLEDIDTVEFRKRLDVTRNNFYSDTFDTGVPAPPPPAPASMAKLDVE